MFNFIDQPDPIRPLLQPPSTQSHYDRNPTTPITLLAGALPQPPLPPPRRNQFHHCQQVPPHRPQQSFFPTSFQHRLPGSWKLPNSRNTFQTDPGFRFVLIVESKAQTYLANKTSRFTSKALPAAIFQIDSSWAETSGSHVDVWSCALIQDPPTPPVPHLASISLFQPIPKPSLGAKIVIY